MTTRRGTRIVTGYVVRLAKDRFDVQEHAIGCAMFWRETAEPKWPSARVLPVVRYELDREEERLRDAVVEAAMKFAEQWPSAPIQHIVAATDALRAHLEKKR